MELTASQRKAFQMGSIALLLSAVVIFIITGWVAALPLFAGGLAIMVLASQAAEPAVIDPESPEHQGMAVDVTDVVDDVVDRPAD